MVPNALVDRIAKSAAQTAAVAVMVLVGGGATQIADRLGACRSPRDGRCRLGCGCVCRCAAEAGPPIPARHADLRELAAEFWTFTAPRGLTGVFQVTILWVGTLMVGNLSSTAAASVYTASTRYLVVGSVVNLAIIQVIGPKLAELLSRTSSSAPGTSTRWPRAG